MALFSDRNIIIGLVLLQLAVCLPFINSFPIALDEPFSIYWAQQDLSEMKSLFSTENNPPLHFVLLHFWIKLFGIGSFSVRSLSLVFSLISVVIIYRFGRKILTKKFTILLLLIFITSRFNHFHALEARTYSLFVLLTILVFYEVYKIVIERKGSFILLAFFNAALLYSHYLGMFVMAVEFLITLIYIGSIERITISRLVLSVLVSAVLYIPGISWFFERLENFTSSGTWVPAPEYSEIYGNIIRFFNNPFAFICCSVFVIVALILKRENLVSVGKKIFYNKKYLFVFLIFSISYFGMFIFSMLIQPVFLDRYLLFTSIPLYFFFVIIIQECTIQKTAGFSFLVLLPLLFATNWVPDNNREPDMEAAYIRSNKTENTLLLICPPFYDLTLLYHFDPKAFSDYKNMDLYKRSQMIQSIYSYEDIQFDSGVKRVLFLDAQSTFIYPENNIKSMLDQNLTIIESKEFKGGFFIYNYSK